MTTEILSLSQRKEILSQVPWITLLKTNHTCSAITIDRAPCKKNAQWKWREGKSRDPYAHMAPSGIYCFAHLIHRCIYYSMDEEERFRKWFEKYEARQEAEANGM